MARTRRVQPTTEAPRIRTRLGKDTRLVGTLRFQDSVEISGALEGNIVAEGYLMIREGAEIRADIRAREIVVAGTVHGNIEATDRLEILETGQIYGNVRTAHFRVADGVIFEGKCEMIRSPDKIDVFAESLEQVRESVVRGE
jgi:cytoskeletal protein CcmA (bactofilin family)